MDVRLVWKPFACPFETAVGHCPYPRRVALCSHPGRCASIATARAADRPSLQAAALTATASSRELDNPRPSVIVTIAGRKRHLGAEMPGARRPTLTLLAAVSLQQISPS